MGGVFTSQAASAATDRKALLERECDAKARRILEAEAEAAGLPPHWVVDTNSKTGAPYYRLPGRFTEDETPQSTYVKSQCYRVPERLERQASSLVAELGSSGASSSDACGATG